MNNAADVAAGGVDSLVDRLRELALTGLPRMFDPAEGRFVFRLQRAAGDGSIRSQGHSDRYTAIALIGLATEPMETRRSALVGADPGEVWERLAARSTRADSIGDVALTLWAGVALGERAREPVLRRLLELDPVARGCPTVELAWTLSALALDADACVGDLRRRLARRLGHAQDPRSAAFPHVIGRAAGLRAHVCCFADLVYPIQALSLYALRHGDEGAAAAVRRAAELIVDRQGRDGQWWWHYDLRTGAVVEGYPVYAVHQDAMAPMALIAAAQATGADWSEAIRRGLRWLERSPELDGRSLIDDTSGLIWRKVARREPAKLTRSIQAAVSRVHEALRVPGLDLAFPPVSIDYEDRPYHLGWLLHCFPPR
jgi:hypothetical protein